MPNTCQLADSTDYLGALENAIRSDDVAREQRAAATALELDASRERATALLSDRAMDLGGLLALFLSRGRIPGAQEARTRRGWRLYTLIGKKALPADLHITPDGVLLARWENSRVLYTVIGIVVAALLIAGFVLSGPPPLVFGTAVGLWMTIAALASLGSALKDKGSDPDSWPSLLPPALFFISAMLGVFAVVHGQGNPRAAIGGGLTVLLSTVAAIASTLLVYRFFGWRTAIAGVDFDGEVMDAIGQIVRPEIEKLGQPLPAVLQ